VIPVNHHRRLENSLPPGEWGLISHLRSPISSSKTGPVQLRKASGNNASFLLTLAQEKPG